ncbi:MAG TPA: carboxypeptidase regulatory-like domain-containing protein [Steroidobacteraceae bacterium]|nr:carboxypeptidase regulatory-like domain-containing protein [Steroidobacteraceae bacterium]
MNTKVGAVRTARRHSFFAGAGIAAMGIAGLLATQSASAAYEVEAVANGGIIDGVVTLSGSPPGGAAIKVTKNQDYCGASIPDPAYTVGAGGGLANVIVYLKDITKGKAAPAEPLALVNEHCMFSPRAQGAMVGGQIKISSNDPVLHNTHPQNAETNATIYNIALPFKGFSVTKPLPASPGMIKVKCDAHEWMHAWIMELDHPYYATTGADGHFTIKDVPPGSYTLVAWHEVAGEKSEPVVIAAGQTAKSKITLAAK